MSKHIDQQVDVPAKVVTLKELVTMRDTLQYQIETLQEEICMEIAEGNGSGDKMLDFLLFVNNSVYDTKLYEEEYGFIFGLPEKHAGETIIICQASTCYVDGEYQQLRNIFLVKIRSGELSFDVDALTIDIPVEPGYILYTESVYDGQFQSGYTIMNKDHVTTGPLYSPSFQISESWKEEDRFFTPPEAVCQVANDLSGLYGPGFEVSEDLHEKLSKSWRQSKLTLVKS